MLFFGITHATLSQLGRRDARRPGGRKALCRLVCYLAPYTFRAWHEGELVHQTLWHVPDTPDEVVQLNASERSLQGITGPLRLYRGTFAPDQDIPATELLREIPIALGRGGKC